jgi:rod shape-determining protein MreC
MESLLNRYRNITVLAIVLCAQLVLLAVQVKNDQDVRLIRVWTVTAVTPAARVIEGLRGGSSGFIRNYILLRDTHDENRRLQSELDRLKIENNFLKTELGTADRAKALAIFQAHSASRMLAASIIGMGAGSNSKVVFVDRGSVAGVQRGMAVVTPDGIVGKVLNAYPTASEVLLITDPDFAAGVISQKSGARGTLKGQGSPLCKVDYVPIEEKVQVGEWLYTSGDDRVFPKAFPVGIVKVVRSGQPFQEILVEPAGLQRGLEDVLILLEGVHQAIPDTPPIETQVYLAPPVPESATPQPTTPQPGTGNTEADRLRQQYKVIGEAQKHSYGENLPGSKAVDFNIKPPAGTQPLAAPPIPNARAAAPAAGAPPATGQTPAGTAPAPRPATPKPQLTPVDPASRKTHQVGPAEESTTPPAPQPAAPPAPNNDLL